MAWRTMVACGIRYEGERAWVSRPYLVPLRGWSLLIHFQMLDQEQDEG